ncbi:MAG: hypothetical protein IJH79_05835 [Lentisphaeria bacterium]|nr:hypothetical protein [Lentisphaeria bacterium]
MHEDPELTCDQILDEYCACFGPAAAKIREYVDFLERQGNELTAEKNDKFKRENRFKGKLGGTFQNYVLIAHEITPLDKIAEGQKILQAAAEAASGNPDVLAKIEFLQKGLRDAELTVRTRLAQIAMTKDPTPENKKLFRVAFNEMKKFRESCEAEPVLNPGKTAFREYFGCQWPWKDNRKRKAPAAKKTKPAKKSS